MKQVWPVRLVPAPDPEIGWIGDPKMKPDPSQQSKAFKSAAVADTFAPHVMTQVDQLRSEGVSGKGVRIAVVDTGVSRSKL